MITDPSLPAPKARRTNRGRRLAGAGVLLGMIGCSDSAPVPVSPRAAAVQGVAGAAVSQARMADVAATIHARLPAGSDPLLGALTHAERAGLATLYMGGAHAPLWVDARGRPTPNAHDALTVLDGAVTHGLDPSDYASAPLRGLAAQLELASPPSTPDIARFDMALTAGMLRYFRHLHLGRVDPRAIGFRLDVPADRHDLVMLLRAALADRRIPEAARDLAPPLVQYALLRNMLAQYRPLATDTRLEALPPFAATVRPGGPYDALYALHRRLVAFGDLPPDTPAPREGDWYEGPLVKGVKQFQLRHGLESDGILGRATHAAMAVPLAWRVRQIELALERMRWLPDLGDERFLVLNIPMFHLWGWDSIPPGGEPSFGMRAIVGRALRTQTPVFVEEMRHVIFRPYWNVPPSILRNEILPVLERDLDYLRREHMEIVRGPGDEAEVVAATPEILALLRQGVLRLRQRPGPHNALGLVKFVFPNDENIYLHGTPAQELFTRTRRDFSHGCVRVEDPVSLAEWVLKDRPEWTRDRIRAAMAGPRPRQVNLPRPIDVILFYTTAVVMPEDGTIRFAEDIYQHDVRLDRALVRPPPGVQGGL